MVYLDHKQTARGKNEHTGMDLDCGVRRDDVRDDGSDDTMIELVMALVGMSLPVMAWIGLVAL